MKIQVTTAGYDNIGSVLKSMNIDFNSYNGKFDCDLLFLNCGTSDTVISEELSKFAERGGIIYASDLTSSIIRQAFPDVFNFKGDIGASGKKIAKVIDGDLKNIIGEEIEINFDMSAWSVLSSINKGKVILASKKGKPYMVFVPIKNGGVFYTCFHNHAQADEKEQTLLKLLVLKQIAQYQSVSIQDASKSLDINLDSYQGVFKGEKGVSYPVSKKETKPKSKLGGSLIKKEKKVEPEPETKNKLTGTLLGKNKK